MQLFVVLLLVFTGKYFKLLLFLFNLFIYFIANGHYLTISLNTDNFYPVGVQVLSFFENASFFSSDGITFSYSTSVVPWENLVVSFSGSLTGCGVDIINIQFANQSTSGYTYFISVNHNNNIYSCNYVYCSFCSYCNNYCNNGYNSLKAIMDIC